MRRILRRNRFSLLRGSNFIFESEASSVQDLALATDGTVRYLDGYWQSEVFFRDFSDEIRGEFCFPIHTSRQNRAIQEMIEGTNSVSLHVRRGDYVNNPKANAVHGTSPLNYYRGAIERFRSALSDPRFFVFSDDISWCRENLGHLLSPADQFVCNNVGNSSFRDMQLMSSCDHHILANSTFSWWGAWLNRSDKKVVVAPRIWFNDGRREAPGLIPSSWIRI